jgi:hypothetical protein
LIILGEFDKKAFQLNPDDWLYFSLNPGITPVCQNKTKTACAAAKKCFMDLQQI